MIFHEHISPVGFAKCAPATRAGRGVLDEGSVPSIFWQPSAPRLKRQELINELKTGADIEGVALSNSEPVLSVRVK